MISSGRNLEETTLCFKLKKLVFQLHGTIYNGFHPVHLYGYKSWWMGTKHYPNMKHLVLVFCFTLSFGFIELSHLNEEQPSYVLLFKSGTKRDSQVQLKVN